MKKITIKNIRDEWEACYWGDDEYKEQAKWVEDHLPATPLEILSWDNITENDRLWVVLRKEIIPERCLHLLACDFADKALSLINEPDRRSVEAIRIKRLWVDNKATGEELTAARAAARDAARDAVWAAAGAAAWAAAWAAAGDAAGASARDAVWAAAGDAQIEMVKAVLIHLAERKDKEET